MASRRFVSSCPRCGQQVRVTWAGEQEELDKITSVKFFCCTCKVRWFPALVLVERINIAQRRLQMKAA
jgi:hypothetical protein